MASRKPSKRTELRAWLEERQPERITEAEWSEALARLQPISGSYLRRLMKEAGVAMAPLVGGIVQDSFEALERTLLEMEAEYSAALGSGEAPRAHACRRAVIEAKNHARWALRKLPPGRRAAKEEMILWMLTWLEHPAAFPAWLRLRKKQAVVES